jgi:hypothetical protein
VAVADVPVTPRLADVACRARLPHVIAHRLASTGPDVDPDLATFAARLDELTGRLRAAQANLLGEMSAALAEAGVEHWLYKGLSLPSWHGHHAWSGDIDVLVAPEAVAEARRALVALDLRQGPFIWGGKIGGLPADRVARIESEPVFYGQLWPFTKLVRWTGVGHLAAFVDRYVRNRGVLVDSEDLVLTISVDLHYSLNRLGEGTRPNEKPALADYTLTTAEQTIGGTRVRHIDGVALAVAVAQGVYHDTIAGGERSWKGLVDLLTMLDRTSVADQLVDWSHRFEHLRTPLAEVADFACRWVGLPASGLRVGELVAERDREPARPYSAHGPLWPHLLAMAPPSGNPRTSVR